MPGPRARPLPYPDSLCHRCAAPPRYVETAASTFILCPLLPNKYPPQPVLACPLFRERAPAGPAGPDDPDGPDDVRGPGEPDRDD